MKGFSRNNHVLYLASYVLKQLNTSFVVEKSEAGLSKGPGENDEFLPQTYLCIHSENVCYISMPYISL